jgi:hypothetical protein
MVDALNIHVSEDLVDDQGNVGVLRSVNGTVGVPYQTDADLPLYDSFRKVIGSVTDEKTKIAYLFVWSESDDDCGIWAYDQYGKLPVSKDQYLEQVEIPNAPEGENIITVEDNPHVFRKIYSSRNFQFRKDSFVKGDIVYSNTREFEKHPELKRHLDSYPELSRDFEKDVILYFTDNHNEPRKINVYRALLEKNDELAGYDEVDTEDFICACPKVPLRPIQFKFDSDEVSSVNNFVATPGFQFAYQAIYKDKLESAISVYSNIAFPPSIVNRGAARYEDLLAHNVCLLTLPTVGAEIQSIRILARYGNSTNFFEIDEVKKDEAKVAVRDGQEINIWDPVTRVYRFYNDRVAAGVDPEEVDKTFDNVPRRAQAQTTAANRLVYGNYLEGYDNVDVDCESSVVYRDRPPSFLNFTLTVNPVIRRTIKFHGSFNSNGQNVGRQKCSGFEISTEEFPDSIAQNTILNVALNVAPDSNFHVYDANSSYHQSRQVGRFSGNYGGYPHYPLILPPDASDYEFNNAISSLSGSNLTLPDSLASAIESEYDQNSNLSSGFSSSLLLGSTDGFFLQRSGERFFGANYGVGAKSSLYNPSDGSLSPEPAMLPQWSNQITGGSGNPKFNPTLDPFPGGSNLRARYGTSAGSPLIIKGGELKFKVKIEVTADILSGARLLLAEVINKALTRRLSEGESIGAARLVSVKNQHLHEFDLELSNYSQILPNSAEGKLICGVGVCDGDVRGTNEGGLFEAESQVPVGYFIVNKASVNFYLESTGGGGTTQQVLLGIQRIDVEQDDILTCVKKIDPNSPWWTFRPSKITDSAFQYSLVANVPEEGNAWYNTIGESILNPEANILDEFRSTFGGVNDGEGNPFPYRTPNKMCFGYLNVTEDRPLMHPVDIFELDQNGVVKQQVFKYSLLDGEAGPGAATAGANSAYDKHGNNARGSIAARVDFGFDASSIRLANVLGFYQAYVGGLGVNSDGDVVSIYGGPTGSSNLALVDQFSEANEQEPLTVNYLPLNDDGSPQQVERYAESYVLSGPFFTGSIAMNPVVGENLESLANPQPFPPVKDYTTTLPLIWSVGGTGSDTIDGSGEEILKNWLKTSYPWPQVGFQPGSGMDNNTDAFIMPSFIDPFEQDDDGYFPNFVLDPTPFKEIQGLDDDDFQDETVAAPHSEFGCVDFSLYHSHIEKTSATSFLDDQESAFGSRSFKSSATHEFGIVYYDQRGRHGYVNHLDTVYVKGYSSVERDAGQEGAAHVRFILNHQPPSWAHNYKIVYSKNTTVDSFFQYSAGGAFVPTGNEQTESGGNKPIYVSLNYLQGHPISYSSAWGGRSKEGSPLIYNHRDGDKLRVISYMQPPLANNPYPTEFPHNAVFEIAGVASLGDENNPLFDINDAGEPIIDENKKGLFLVLKDNSEVSDFRHAAVKNGNDKWSDNCIIELFSPIKEIDADERLYYEVGETYPVVKDQKTGELYHSVTDITVTEGDVYFRRTAVNLREFDEDPEDGLTGYQDLIVNQPEDSTDATVSLATSESNFKSYYLESEAANDTFTSDGISIGRPNIINSDARESVKEASVIHSDKDIVEAGKVSYSSFNRSKPIDKDLDLKSGAINHISNFEDSIFVIQADKCGHLPIDRTLLSDVNGEESLIASSKFLGNVRYYTGQAGCDNNPESVVIYDNIAYFAHKSLGKIFKVSRANGVNKISDNNMGAFFRELFDRIKEATRDRVNLSDIRVVGGYDPQTKEYLITVLTADSRLFAFDLPNGINLHPFGSPGGLNPVFTTSGIQQFNDPDIIQVALEAAAPPPPVEEEVEDTTEGNGDITLENLLSDTNEDGIINSTDLLNFLSQYGITGENLTADVDQDGTVTAQDLLALLSEYGFVAPQEPSEDIESDEETIR